MFTKSIRWRFQLWLAFLLACVLIGFGLTAYQLVRTKQTHDLYEQLQRRLSAVSSDLSGGPRGRPPAPRDHPPRGRPEDAPPPDGPRPEPPSIRLSPEVLSLFDQASTNGFYFVIWNRDGVERMRSSNAPADLEIVSRVGRSSGPQVRAHGKYLESFLQHAMGYRVMVGRSIAPELAGRWHFALWLIAAGGGVLAVGLCGSWWLAGRTLRPIEDISNTAARISAGNLADRINVADTDDELGRLAGVLNSTFARLEAAFAQQKQFTGDASHELRTPLTVMISEAQTTLSRERTGAEYRETVEVCLDTAQQMRRLTEPLLELARLDAGQNELQRARLDLAELARACVELIHPLADPRGIRIECKLDSAEVLGDADLLNRVITNLLTNSIHYNKPNGEVRVTTRAENEAVILTIADTGVGIAPEDLSHIFERFYRADKSRARAHGGTGLGLAICKAIVDAHGGSMEVSSRPDSGAVFTVRLPA